MTKPTLYICGDSFCSSDPDYGKSWTDTLADQLPEVNVINLSTTGASNYFIYLQVKHAIEQGCEYLIYNATGSTRQEFPIKNTHKIEADRYERYCRVEYPETGGDMICVSWVRTWADQGIDTMLSPDDYASIKNFFTNFVDFGSVIEKNYIFISHTLNMIAQSPIKQWAWSQGGFEHKNFNPIASWDFQKYRSHEVGINLWDYYDSTKVRPYYHVDDLAVVQSACTQYKKMLKFET